MLRVVPKEGWLAEVVLQEHERWEGQGYPHGLKGTHIHEFSRIIGLVDTFETLLNSPASQEKQVPYDVIRTLLATEKAAFTGQLLKILVEQISFFPVGTFVRLNTGDTGIIHKTNPRYPLRPTVRITQSSERIGRNASAIIDLSEDHLVHVVAVAQPDGSVLRA